MTLFWQNTPGLRWPCFQQAGTHLKAALRVLFFLTKAIRTRPSHSFSGQKKTQRFNIYNSSPRLDHQQSHSINYLILTWKLTGGGGFFGSILTTLDSTFGGGRKLFFPTWSRGKHQHWDTVVSTQEKTLMKINPLKTVTMLLCLHSKQQTLHTDLHEMVYPSQ